MNELSSKSLSFFMHPLSNSFMEGLISQKKITKNDDSSS